MPLQPGSIAFTGFNADGNDDIAFVVLEEIAAGTVIYFNDREWQGSAFNTGEGELTFTATTTIDAGTVVTISSYSSSPAVSTGTISGSSGIGNSDEIIYAFVGSPNTPTTFLAAVANSGFAVSGGTLAGTELVVGQTAIDLGALGGAPDIAAYTGPRTGSSAAELAQAINTATNWISQDATGDQSGDGTAPDLPFDRTAFTIGGEPAPTVTVGFASGSLAVSQVEGDAGTTSYSFTLTRDVTDGELVVGLNFAVGATQSTDFAAGTLPTGLSATFADGASSATVTVEVAGDTLAEADENFSLSIAGFTSSSSTSYTFVTATGAGTATGTIANDDVAAPVPNVTILDAAESLQGALTAPVGSGSISLVRLGSIAGSGATAAGRAEAIAFDPATGRAFTTNAAQNAVDITQIGADGSLTAIGTIDLDALADSGNVNSVAVKNGILAVAYESETPGQPGYVTLFDTDGNAIKRLTVGVLPDQLTFSPDGSKLLVANEAETLSAGNNPVGGVTIIDVSAGAAAAAVLTTIGFEALNGREAELKAAGLNTFPGQAAAADIEPEYITVSPDGTRAYVTLQEVNAVAVIDLTDPDATAPIAILPLGSIDRMLAGNAFDASDRDGISLENFDVASLLQPDAIASYQVGGVTYFITANEGDSRVGVTDEVRLGAAGYVLDPTAYPDAAALKNNNALGRLTVISTAGDTDGDGDIDQITTYGGRGISIFRQNVDGTIDKVRETGGEFEAIIARDLPGLFNSENGADVDSRSDNKGPEPEGVSIGVVNGRIYAFVTLERIGGVIVYDVTDPANATYVGYTPATAQDYAPEVSTFVSAADSPTGTALLLSANEVSGTLTLYEADAFASQAGTADADRLRGGTGRDVIEGQGGNDRLGGFAGNDVLRGGAGDDTLDGGTGADRMEGGAGNDLYFVDDSRDVVTELAGGGNDSVRASIVSYALDANVEVLQFTSGQDSTGTGNALGNTLFGAAGDDTLSGLGGDDRLVGGGGDDVLTGGAGRDTLEGGTGADRFVFAPGDTTVSLLKPDAVRDFSDADRDVVDLTAFGPLDFIGAGAFSGNGSGEVRTGQMRGNTVLFGDTDGDGVADFAIELVGSVVLSDANVLTGDQVLL